MKKKQKLPMKEILIAAGALAAILVIALVIGYFKKSTVSELEGKNRAQVEILERNVKLATDELKKAVGLGTLYCVGKETGELKDTSAKLLAPFKSNPKIYNIFYGRDFKDKKQAEKHEQIALNDDQEHRTLDELNKAIPEDLNKAIQEDKDLKDATVKYAMAHEGDKKIAVIIAKKIVRSAKEDNVNSGGQITVIVRAEEDDFFKKAMSKTFDAPVKAPETKPAATDAKK